LAPEDANFTYQYDNNGNLTRKTPKDGSFISTYEYDAENKLVRFVNDGTSVNYKYDGLGRRVEKDVIKSMSLRPRPDTIMGRRNGMAIHGGDMTNRTSSDGCIVLPLDIRRVIAASGDHELRVVP